MAKRLSVILVLTFCLGLAGSAFGDCPDMILYCRYSGPPGSRIIMIGTCADTWGNCGASNCGHGRGTCESYIQSCADQAGVPVSQVCQVTDGKAVNETSCNGRCGR